MVGCCWLLLVVVGCGWLWSVVAPKSIKNDLKKDSETDHLKSHQFQGPGPSWNENGLEKGAPD